MKKKSDVKNRIKGYLESGKHRHNRIKEHEEAPEHPEKQNPEENGDFS
jgi:hypothetical protein